MRRTAMVGAAALLAAVEALLPNPSAGGEITITCRLPQRTPVHWLRPLSDRPLPAFSDAASPAGQSRLPESG